MNHWTLLAALTLLGICGAVFVQVSERRRVARTFAGRRPLTAAEFAARYFDTDKRDVAERVRSLLDESHPFDCSRIAPDDRLIEDTRLDALDGMDSTDFIIDVERTFGIAIPNEQGTRMRTLRDIVDYVHKVAPSDRRPSPTNRPM